MKSQNTNIVSRIENLDGCKINVYQFNPDTEKYSEMFKSDKELVMSVKDNSIFVETQNAVTKLSESTVFVIMNENIECAENVEDDSSVVIGLTNGNVFRIDVQVSQYKHAN